MTCGYCCCFLLFHIRVIFSSLVTFGFYFLFDSFFAFASSWVATGIAATFRSHDHCADSTRGNSGLPNRCNRRIISWHLSPDTFGVGQVALQEQDTDSGKGPVTIAHLLQHAANRPGVEAPVQMFFPIQQGPFGPGKEC